MTAPTTNSNPPPAFRHVHRDDEAEIDLGQIWSILANGKKTIALFVVGALLLGVAYLFVATPIYRTYALLQVQSPTESAPLPS